MRSGIKWLLCLLAVLGLSLAGTGPGIGSYRGPVAAPPVFPPGGRTILGSPITRIVCRHGARAWLYASGLDSPDGLAFDLSGRLHVVEEGAGRVSRLGPAGDVTPVVSGLNSPEGVAFSPDGTMYVVEDVAAGRLLQVAPGGEASVLAGGLSAPEGVVWAGDGTVYVTESNAQFVSNPVYMHTRITAVAPTGLTSTVRADDFLWSYAGLAVGADGLLYVTNEGSGLLGNDSLFTVRPATGERVLLAGGMSAPEGLRFTGAGEFPLYVVEEDTGGGEGRLQRVYPDGRSEILCTGFYSIEDVAIDADGWLYVSEDASGWVITIEPPADKMYIPLIFRQ